MIRKLMEQDRAELFSFLEEEKAMNLFIIGDIENFGFNQDFQELWGEFDASGAIKAVLLRYYHAYLPYAKGDFNTEAFAAIIRQDDKAEVISGKKEVVERFSPSLTFSRQKQLYFAEMKDDAVLAADDQSFRGVQKATIDDCDAIFSLKEQIAEFQLGSSVRESFRKDLSAGTGRTYFYQEEGEILASASTTAENSFSAMVVGVCTHPKARRRGLATLCMQRLCGELLQEGRTLCLFYDNPAAGSIYRRIGFREIGLWNLHYL